MNEPEGVPEVAPEPGDVTPARDGEIIHHMLSDAAESWAACRLRGFGDRMLGTVDPEQVTCRRCRKRLRNPRK